MKQKIFSLSIALLFYSISFSQVNPLFNTLTPEKRAEDSLSYLKSKIENPEIFLNKRLPVTLLDGNYYVAGYAAFGIRITNNHLIDSVYHNFNRGSEGSGIPPYNSMQVTEEKVSVDLMNPMFFGGYPTFDTCSIIEIDQSHLKEGRLDNKPYTIKPNHFAVMGQYNNFFIDTIGIQKFDGDSTEIRISLNGKLLFDWTPLDKFAKNVFKTASKSKAILKKSFWFIQYHYGYHICDENLKINDQLLIEIKDDKNGWMLDRFNITRVAAQPTISSIIPTDNNNVLLTNEEGKVTVVEKKTSLLIRMPKN